MSSINSINAIQQQFTDLAPSSISDTNNILAGEGFEKALDIAMDAKSLVLPAPVNLAVDTAVDMLEDKGVLSSLSSQASMKDSIKAVFDDLSVGIASSFVAGLAGADSATAVKATTEELAAKANVTNNETTDQATDDSSLVSAKTVADVKAAFDGIVPHLTNNKAVPIASTALSALEDVLLESEKQDKQQTGS